MKFTFYVFALAILLVSCDQPTTRGVETATTNGQIAETPTPESVEKITEPATDYILEDISNSDIKTATIRDASGMIVETGGLLNGKKTGTWVENHKETEYPAKVIAYANGLYNGLYLEINDRGQIEIMAYYKDNVLNGPWAKMRFGRAEMKVDYVDGERHGIYREFDFRNGRIKKDITYKHGVEDGPMRNYDEEGNVTVEYIYKDGQKISGGIVK